MKILRVAETLSKTGDTRSPLYEKVAQGLFTKPIKLGGRRAAGWPEHEVDAIVTARIAGSSDDEVRKLVGQLHQSRKLRFYAVRAALAEAFGRLDQAVTRTRTCGSVRSLESDADTWILSRKSATTNSMATFAGPVSAAAKIEGGEK